MTCHVQVRATTRRCAGSTSGKTVLENVSIFVGCINNSCGASKNSQVGPSTGRLPTRGRARPCSSPAQSGRGLVVAPRLFSGTRFFCCCFNTCLISLWGLLGSYSYPCANSGPPQCPKSRPCIPEEESVGSIGSIILGLYCLYFLYSTLRYSTI